MIIHGYNAPVAYEEAIWKLRICGKKETSRNGEVLTIPYPVLLEIENPWQRLITDPVRDANPFFHAMEFIWMMAGSQDVTWLAKFNKRMLEYSDDGKILYGAYGQRWRKNWDEDQITVAVDMLKRNSEDRRIVLQMWDPRLDLDVSVKDLPCNTQIMLRVVEGKLDFLVTNRSNDAIWGAFGANVVHMTMLQELMAQAAGLKLGRYRVVSNNFHVYTGMPRYTEIFNSPTAKHDIYRGITQERVPLLGKVEYLGEFLKDCEDLVAGSGPGRTRWMSDVGLPMYNCYLSRKNDMPYDVNLIKDDYWRKACSMWLERRSRGSSHA